MRGVRSAGIGLAINAYNLLARRVGHACENARLGHGRVTLVLENSAHGDVFMPESFDEQPARLVVSYDADREHVHIEVREIIDRVRAAHRARPCVRDVSG